MKYILLVILLSLSFNNLQSQTNCDSVFFDVVLESQDLNEFCELNTGMPFEVLLSYIALDSLCTKNDYKDWFYFLENQTTFNDTLKTIYNFLYKTVDYNPVLFDKNKRFTNIDYKIHPMSVLQNLEDKLEFVSTNPMLDKALLFSHYIVKVKVENIINKVDPESYAGNTLSFVQCSITDTIKGKVAPACYYFNTNNHNSFSNIADRTNSTQILDIGSCLEFGYSPQWKLGKSTDDRTISYKGIVDSLGNSWLKVDEEYILFLTTFGVCRDSSTFYTTIRPLGLESNTFTMYPIKSDGTVFNPDNDFGYGNIDEQLFINALRNRIQYLTN